MKSFHQETLRVQFSLWHSALRFKEAELHQQLLQLLYRVVCYGPRRHCFTRRPFDFGFCRGTVLCDPKRPSCLSPEPRQVPDVLLALSGLVVCKGTTWPPTVPPISTRWHVTIGNLDLDFPCSLPGPQSGPLAASRFRVLRW